MYNYNSTISQSDENIETDGPIVIVTFFIVGIICLFPNFVVRAIE